MADDHYLPGRRERTVRTQDGAVIDVPEGWELLPPGDAGVTRKVKALGDSWTVKEKRGRRLFSQGVWAPAENIAAAQAHMEAQRADPAHQRKLEQARRRREEDQKVYVRTFQVEVRKFLAFAPEHRELERELAQRIAAHATPVGSGTVARTQRIPVEKRAQAAVIAWMRHQTTAYDDMHIPRVKGKRREVRRMLAQRSRALLRRYQEGGPVSADCPLKAALDQPVEGPAPAPAGPRGRAPLEPQTALQAEQQARYEAVRARMAARSSRSGRARRPTTSKGPPTRR